jgi:hypothetical protein
MEICLPNGDRRGLALGAAVVLGHEELDPENEDPYRLALALRLSNNHQLTVKAILCAVVLGEQPGASCVLVSLAQRRLEAAAVLLAAGRAGHQAGCFFALLCWQCTGADGKRALRTIAQGQSAQLEVPPTASTKGTWMFRLELSAAPGRYICLRPGLPSEAEGNGEAAKAGTAAHAADRVRAAADRAAEAHNQEAGEEEEANAVLYEQYKCAWW